MRRVLDRAAGAFFTLAAAMSLLLLLMILGFVTARGIAAIDLHFLFTSVTSSGGIAANVIGTAILVATALTFALPLAVGSALTTIYLRSERLARVADTALQAVNTIPSIVFGLVGLALIVRAGMGKSWLAGGIVLGVMILPTITISFLERIRSIDVATLEAAYGLGLSKSDVVREVMIPAGLGGLVSGSLLGISRAAGETAPILFTAAVFSGPAVPTGIADSPVLALPYHIFVLAQDSLDPAASSSMWGAAFVLLALVLSLSAASLPFRMRITEESRRG